MSIELEFTSHAFKKLQERYIEKEEIIEIVRNPEEILLDTETGNLIFVGIRPKKVKHRLIVVLSADAKKVITMFDTKKQDIIKNRMERKRWLKIR